MKLTTTNDKIQVVLGGSVTTNQLQCLTTYKIFTSTTGLTTALPATAAAPATVTTSFWGCVS